MTIDKKYCCSSFLMYRRIVDTNYSFKENIHYNFDPLIFKRVGVKNSDELYINLQKQVDEATKDGKAALALSGGIDSAILAKMMPKGSIAYTFKCVVPGIEVVDESVAAAKIAKECGLKHKIVEIYWEDFVNYLNTLMIHKGSPVHSIEIQIYKASLVAKEDGIKRIIYGESADCIFGGLSNLLSKEWLVGDFIDRYCYVMPYKVLKDYELVLEPILRHEKNGLVDPHVFLSTEFFPESVNSYINASETAGIEAVLPYSRCFLDCPIDYSRIRKGENKYIIRDLFKALFNQYEIPPKTPMPRPMNEWLTHWRGPIRDEFWPNCVGTMTGDQKWLVYCLEQFLNLIEKINISY